MVNGYGMFHDQLSLLGCAGQAIGMSQPPLPFIPAHHDEQVTGVVDALCVGLREGRRKEEGRRRGEGLGIRKAKGRQVRRNGRGDHMQVVRVYLTEEGQGMSFVACNNEDSCSWILER